MTHIVFLWHWVVGSTPTGVTEERDEKSPLFFVSWLQAVKCQTILSQELEDAVVPLLVGVAKIAPRYGFSDSEMRFCACSHNHTEIQRVIKLAEY